VTIAASSYMILYNHELYDWTSKVGILRLFRATADEEEQVSSRPRDHIIVVGMNSLGRYLVRELAGRGEEVLAVDTDPAKLEGLPGRSILGSAEYYSTLEEANLPEARMLVSALQIEDTNIEEHRHSAHRG
jgi:voltage-gated potassium channel Kch